MHCSNWNHKRIWTKSAIQWISSLRGIYKMAKKVWKAFGVYVILDII